MGRAKETWGEGDKREKVEERESNVAQNVGQEPSKPKYSSCSPITHKAHLWGPIRA